MIEIGELRNSLVPDMNPTDMICSLVEWNGRLAETIVAQADQIVELNKELRLSRSEPPKS